MDPAIEALKLAPAARAAAYALKAAFPEVVFTSGRRDRGQQTHAMATNVVQKRDWIKRTYRDTPVRAALQDWVDTHPQATTVPVIAQGLLDTLDALPDAQVAELSKHLTGQAFDVEPLPEGPQAEAIKTLLENLVRPSGKFLPMEGGLVRWHAEF
jgi:hypothetical protein